MLSRKPNQLRSSAAELTSCGPDRDDARQIAHRVAAQQRCAGLAGGRCSARAPTITMWISPAPNGRSQCSGAFSPTSPRRLGPRRHALLELEREAGERLVRHAEGLEPCERERDGRATPAGADRKPATESRSGISRRSSSRPSRRSSMRNPRYTPAYGVGRDCRAPRLDVVQLQRDGRFDVHADPLRRPSRAACPRGTFGIRRTPGTGTMVEAGFVALSTPSPMRGPPTAVR